jgi:hypothetical protein
MRSLSAGFCMLAMCSGCAVDSRTLYAAGDQGGSAQGGTSASSAGSGSSTKPPDPIPLPMCSYSEEVEPGCETIVMNAGFEAGIDGWRAEPLAIDVDWAQDDATGADQSGSISVLNHMHGKTGGLAAAGGMQCLRTSPGTIYDMAGDIFVPEGQGDGVDERNQIVEKAYVGQAGLSLLFWPNDACSDATPSKAAFQTSLVTEPGKWLHVEGTARAPEGTQSMSMRVLTVKSFLQFSFEARFDNVLLQER